MTDLICRLVYSLPLFVLRLMWHPFIYLVDRPLTKVFGLTKGNRCRWWVEVVATMRNRGVLDGPYDGEQ